MATHECGPTPGKCQDWHAHALEVERGERPADGVFQVTPTPQED